MSTLITFLLLGVFLAILYFLLDSLDNDEMFVIKNKLKAKEEKKENVPILCELNKKSVRYLFYSKSTFLSAQTKMIYKDLVVNTLWLQEPFHTALVRLLVAVEKNKLWIKVPDSKELILNSRNRDGTFSRGISLKIVYLSTFLSHILVSIKLKYIYTEDREYVQQYILAYIIKLMTIANRVESVELSEIISSESIFLLLNDLFDSRYELLLEEMFYEKIDHGMLMQNIAAVLHNMPHEKHLIKLDDGMESYNQEPIYLPYIQKKQLIQLEAY